MAVMADAGEPLSPQAADLVRRIARVFLDEPADLMAELHAAVLAAADEPLRSEPVLAAEVAASNRANVLHLAGSMLRDPGGRVPANLTPEVLGIAREAFRRGIEQAVYTTYHAGQNAVWAYWMRTAFSLSSDPAALRQALEAGSRSLSGFIDDTVAALSEQLRRERADLARSSHRNTVLNRLQRAERLLPLPLAGRGLEVGVALEIVQWLGTAHSRNHQGS
jgi:DNA-binding PucR family transcriptional regulator